MDILQLLFAVFSIMLCTTLLLAKVKKNATNQLCTLYPDASV